MIQWNVGLYVALRRPINEICCLQSGVELKTGPSSQTLSASRSDARMVFTYFITDEVD